MMKDEDFDCLIDSHSRFVRDKYKFYNSLVDWANINPESAQALKEQVSQQVEQQKRNSFRLALYITLVVFAILLSIAPLRELIVITGGTILFSCGLGRSVRRGCDTARYLLFRKIDKHIQ